MHQREMNKSTSDKHIENRKQKNVNEKKQTKSAASERSKKVWKKVVNKKGEANSERVAKMQ